VDVSARHAFYDIVKKRRGPSVRRKASEFEIIRVMSELNQNGYRLIVQRLGNWAAVHMRRPGGIREAKDALTRCAVMGFDLDAMDLAFINGQIRQN
jgi:hypothetical protein